MDFEPLLKYFVRTRVPYPTSLAPHEIRLMALLPGKWSDDLRCEVFRAAWKGEPKMLEYKALSYAWGLPSRNDPCVLVNDCPVKVTINLAYALRHERLPDKCVILWVDALCIDQENNPERTFQVSQMHKIYSTAAEVIVYVGNGMQQRRVGSRRIGNVGRCAFENTSSDDVFTSQSLSAWKTPSPPKTITEFDIFCLLSILARPQGSSNPFAPLEGIPEASLRAMFEGLRRMLTGRWWDRIWVVQEAVVAKTITLRYGSVSAPWAILTDAARVHSQQTPHQETSQVSIDDSKVLSLLSKATDIDRLRRTWRQDQRPDLLSVLREFSSRKASDERDKIYALLGLCNSETQLKPDYSRDVRTAYQAATIDIIRASKSLDVLSGDVGRKNRQDLPSWVPDWSATFDEHDRRRVCLLDKYNACGDVKSSFITGIIDPHTIDQMTLLAETLKVADDPAELLPLCFSQALRAFGQLHPSYLDLCNELIKYCHPKGSRDVNRFVSPGFIVDDPTIRLGKYNDERSWKERKWDGCIRTRGKFVATVDHTFEPLYSSSDMKAVSNSIMAWYKEVLRLTGTVDYGGDLKERATSYGALNSTKKAFVTILLSDIKKTPNGFERLEEGDGQAIMTWYRMRIEGQEPVPGEDQPTTEELDAFTEVFQLSITKRAFFITKDGRMGLGPASIARDDEVFIFPGGNLPFILRHTAPPGSVEQYIETARTTRLVGDCFLHGAMDGMLTYPQEGSLPDYIIDRTIDDLKQEWDQCMLQVTRLVGPEFFKKRVFLSRRWVTLTSLAFLMEVGGIMTRHGTEQKKQDIVTEHYHKMKELGKVWMALNTGWFYLI
ncbi:heterokaryon incompatibility (het-6OR allele) [Fusarium albosuccineum]|uniref:Heterokaryon incompatibility (Het-6OR allele) n=1 Tax=Fusarium albosuccineum TaxID=1237068 RepID=A0A8H4L0C9_9HYPO|nr:heterokaryon incompatibility (het-6OR allele) [Fusarium albosuccineum]